MCHKDGLIYRHKNLRIEQVVEDLRFYTLPMRAAAKYEYTANVTTYKNKFILHI